MPLPFLTSAYGIWKTKDLKTYTQQTNYIWPNDIIEIFVIGAGGAGGTPGGWTFGCPGGSGGLASAYMKFPTSTTTFYIVVGKGGMVNQMQYYDGGGGIAVRDGLLGIDNRYGSGGGGYSGIFTNPTPSQNSAILIAGGGGGGGSSKGGSYNQGGAGGGLIGEDGYAYYDAKVTYRGRGGSQTAAGVNAACDTPQSTNGFQGALLGGSCLINGYGGAGGGGYWGGSAGGYSEINTMAGGGGGSGYANTTLFLETTLTTGIANTVGHISGIAMRVSEGNAGNASQDGTNGLVYFKYSGSPRASGGTIVQSSGDTYHLFYSSGSITLNT